MLGGVQLAWQLPQYGVSFPLLLLNAAIFASCVALCHRSDQALARQAGSCQLCSWEPVMYIDNERTETQVSECDEPV